jgi:hypothetical protein
MDVLASVGCGFLLMKLGKLLDIRLGEYELQRMKSDWKLEAHWKSLALQSWGELYVRSAVATELFFSKIFGSRLISFKSIGTFLLFSLLLNFFLISFPLALAIGAEKVLSSNGLKVFLAMVAAFSVVNALVDTLAYLLTRSMLRRPPISGRKIFLSFLIVSSVAWLAVSVSLVVGSAATVLPMVGLSSEALHLVFWPLIKGWINFRLLDPFHSNVSVEGLDLGYSAIGALPSFFVLITLLLSMLLLKYLAKPFHKELCYWTGRMLSKKDGLFEYLGIFVSFFLIAIWVMYNVVMWVAARLS